MIFSGSSIDLDELLIFEAPRDGKTMWEICIPNRSASKFFIPDPDPKYVNRLFLDHPASDWTKDRFFAHVGMFFSCIWTG